MNKRNILLLSSVLVIVLAVTVGLASRRSKLANKIRKVTERSTANTAGQQKTGSTALKPKADRVVFSVNFGAGNNKKSEYKITSESTPLELLGQYAAENNLELEVREYELGSVLNAIGEYPNGQDAVWVFYLNGKLGDQPADKLIVNNGDVVEWRYEKPPE